MKTAKRIDLAFVYGVDDFPGQEFGLLPPVHFARRRNSPACSAEVFWISFFAFSMDNVRTGGSARSGALDGGGVRVIFVTFSMKHFLPTLL